MAEPLSKIAAERGIKNFLIAFTDLFGMLRAKLVPAAAIDKMAEEGAGFAGFATWLDLGPAMPDLFARPDPSTLIQLPWRREIGWMAADLYMEGALVDQAPRTVLKRTLAQSEGMGYSLKTGVECEFFLLTPDASQVADVLDAQSKPCYDQQALMRRYDVIAEIMDAMLELGWQPYQSDHEDANGQFEMNWEYDHALVTADRHVFFKYMAKSIAEKHGLRATFMPKPFLHLTGSGCHSHISMWQGNQNVFSDPSGEAGLSSLAYHFLGGLLAHAGAITALTNPTINSYKRLCAPRTLSGASWAPNAVSYTGNNRTHMVRIPDGGRFELRLADGATNPYLLQAGLLAAGLDGIAKQTSPGTRCDFDMYAEPDRGASRARLPLNLLDAIRAMEGSSMLTERLGSSFVKAYSKLKMQEWMDFSRHLSEWERVNTLDC